MDGEPIGEFESCTDSHSRGMHFAQWRFARESEYVRDVNVSAADPCASLLLYHDNPVTLVETINVVSDGGDDC